MEGLKKEKFYLDCIYDNRKSFYNKAYYEIEHVKSDDFMTYKIMKLYSYDTLVCEIYFVEDRRNNITHSYYKLNKYSFYSNTTTRHVKEFIKQFATYNEVKKLLINKNYTKSIIEKYNRVTGINKNNALIYAI